MITLSIEEKTLTEDIIRKNKVCYVGMTDINGFPYVIPMNFGYNDGIIHLHSGQEGLSKTSLEKNPDVCVVFCSPPSLVYQNEEVACSYRMKGSSVLCRGKVVFEEDPVEKIKSLDLIMQQYTDKKFDYSAPAVKNVKIWKIRIDEISTKVFGAPHPKSPNYTDQDYSQY